MASGRCAREVAGPGFVNVWLADDRWRRLLPEILGAGARYGASDAGKGRAVQVEFVSANPTGPLSVGHGRQAVLGDCIARLLVASGWKVTREYYFNNGGRQMRVLGESVKARYLELLGRAAPPPKDALEDANLPWPEAIGGTPGRLPARRLPGRLHRRDRGGDPRARPARASWTSPATDGFRQVAEATIFAGIRTTLETLGIRFDVYFNETSLYESGKIEEVLRDLRATGLRLRRGRRGVAARDRARAPARPRAREEQRASRPICCPTSRITARSSGAASNASST